MKVLFPKALLQKTKKGRGVIAPRPFLLVHQTKNRGTRGGAHGFLFCDILDYLNADGHTSLFELRHHQLPEQVKPLSFM